MKLAYLVSQYLAVNHTYLVREVETLRSLGFDILVVSISPPDRPDNELAPAERALAATTLNVKSTPLLAAARIHAMTLFTRPAAYLSGLVCALRLGTGAGSALRQLFYFGEAVIAGHWIKERGISHFHVHYSSTVGMLVARVFPLTMSITFHGRAEFVDPVSFRLAEKVQASSFVCGISHFARSRIVLACGASAQPKVEVCRLGVDPAAYVPGSFRPAPPVFEILSVGQLVPVKAHHVLLNAIARVVRDGHSVRLRLVGDGPDAAALKAQAADLGLGQRVIFDGKVNHDRVAALYAQADLFALSSLDEGVPVVLMEAMTMEVACVATHVAGIPELIRHGVDGLLVPPSDEEGLAAAISQLLDDPDLRRSLGQSARGRIVEVFNLKKNGMRLAEIFRRRLQAGASPN
ncbi:MAG: glycosyltransferase family 4 protein [Bryobacteraceae bacterium]|nr:glycosyltransferase family 4 protein [Bryobacteraceae bacterium]